MWQALHNFSRSYPHEDRIRPYKTCRLIRSFCHAGISAFKSRRQKRASQPCAFPCEKTLFLPPRPSSYQRSETSEIAEMASYQSASWQFRRLTRLRRQSPEPQRRSHPFPVHTPRFYGLGAMSVARTAQSPGRSFGFFRVARAQPQSDRTDLRPNQTLDATAAKTNGRRDMAAHGTSRPGGLPGRRPQLSRKRSLCCKLKVKGLGGRRQSDFAP